MLIDQANNSQAVSSPLCDVRVSSNEKNDCTKAGGDISVSLVSQSQPILVRYSRRYNQSCRTQINAESSFLYQVHCEFCTKQSVLTNHRFLEHMRVSHRLEAEFKCVICFRHFSGFNSFVNHIKKHESNLAVSRSEEVDNFLSSQSGNSADVSTDSSCVTQSLHEPGNSGLAAIISSSFLGKQSRVYSWCKAKYQQGSYDGTFCCKFKNCSVQNLSLGH